VVRITWLAPEERLEHELRQLREEGADAGPIGQAWQAARGELEGDGAGLRRRALELLDAAATTSRQRPSTALPRELTEALSTRSERLTFTGAELRERLQGAWTGRLAGCLLGKPVEKVPREGIRDLLVSAGEWPLRRYFSAEGVPAEVSERWPWNRASRATSLREHITVMPEDDDINYTMVALLVLETSGADFATDDVATAWLQTMPPLTVFTAERVTMQNLLAHIDPPESARYRNPYREWIGAQIRADMWGYVRPGDGASAAELAWRDARLSHVENGVYAELLTAAMVAFAFVEPDPLRLVRRSLELVPADSRLAGAVDWAAGLAAAGGDWEHVLDALHERLGGYHWVHAVNNAALVAAALVHGRGEFEASVTRVVMGGWDTDSNGATVGSITGVLGGRAGVPDAWTAPLRGHVRTSLKGFDGISIDELVRRTIACVPGDRVRAGAA
jgi:ADP-ribosylglycohydrolase